METQNLDTKDCITPNNVAHELADNVMPMKAGFRKSKAFVLAIAAGAFIAFGAQVSLTVMTGTESVSWGLAKLVGAMTFATGLMMVVLTGAELFTGNVMMTFAVIEKKVSNTDAKKYLLNEKYDNLTKFIASPYFKIIAT